MHHPSPPDPGSWPEPEAPRSARIVRLILWIQVAIRLISAPFVRSVHLPVARCHQAVLRAPLLHPAAAWRLRLVAGHLRSGI